MRGQIAVFEGIWGSVFHLMQRKLPGTYEGDLVSIPSNREYRFCTNHLLLPVKTSSGATMLHSIELLPEGVPLEIF